MVGISAPFCRRSSATGKGLRFGVVGRLDGRSGVMGLPCAGVEEVGGERVPAGKEPRDGDGWEARTEPGAAGSAAARAR